MKRTPFKRTSELRSKEFDPTTGERRFSTFASPTKESLRRMRFKWKRRRPKKGDDPRYLRWVRKWPCVVGGRKCGKRSRAHHAIEMGGQQERGMSLKAPDSETLPLCEKHHTQFHLRQGFCKGWSDEQRRVFQQDEIDRLRAIWKDEQELGVTQEPMRKAI